jgi:diketogulonate reductase-like aldo/keto reductase
MNIPTKSLKSGFTMPVFGIGTWKMGGILNADPKNDEQDRKGLRIALELGVTLIDTADLYGAGHAEELVGVAIKGFDRDKLFIVSKVYKDKLAYDDVIKACRASLERLRTDYLDLYLIHAPNPEIPIKDTFKALDELKEQGLIREIGVSNFTIDELKEAQSVTKNKIVVNQLHYNLAYQNLQEAVDYCRTNDIMVMAYRPIERGALIEKEIPVIEDMCKKYGKSKPQIVINWLISQGIVTISKMSDPKHLMENLKSLDFTMDKEDIERLRVEIPEIQLPETTIKFNK